MEYQESVRNKRKRFGGFTTGWGYISMTGEGIDDLTNIYESLLKNHFLLYKSILKDYNHVMYECKFQPTSRCSPIIKEQNEAEKLLEAALEVCEALPKLRPKITGGEYSEQLVNLSKVADRIKNVELDFKFHQYWYGCDMC